MYILATSFMHCNCFGFGCWMLYLSTKKKRAEILLAQMHHSSALNTVFGCEIFLRACCHAVESEKTNPVLAAQISVQRGLGRDLARARASLDQTTFNSTSNDNSTLFSGLTWKQLSTLKSNVSIEPPLLQFGSQALCIPAASTFEIINICETAVEVFSVTGNNAQFHTTKFGSTILEPKQKAAVRVCRRRETYQITVLIRSYFDRIKNKTRKLNCQH